MSSCYTGAHGDAVSTDVSASAMLIAGMVPGGQEGLEEHGSVFGQKPFAQVSFQFPGNAALSRKKKGLERNSKYVASG